MLEFFKRKINLKVWESLVVAGVVFGLGLFTGVFGFYAGLVLFPTLVFLGLWTFYFRHK